MIYTLFCTDRLTTTKWTLPHSRPNWPRSGRCPRWTAIPLTRAPCWLEKPSPGDHTAPRRFRASLRTSLKSFWLFRSSSGLSWCVISPGRPSTQGTKPSRRFETLLIRLFWENKYFSNAFSVWFFKFYGSHIGGDLTIGYRQESPVEQYPFIFFCQTHRGWPIQALVTHLLTH